MDVRKLEFRYAYEFADRVVSTVYAPEEEASVIADFFADSDESFLRAISTPQKDTLLHQFIRNWNFSVFDFITGHSPEEAADELAAFLHATGTERPKWLTYDLVRPHVHELDLLLESASAVVTTAAFHLLYADRRFLFEFQRLVAAKVRSLDYEEHQDILKRPGMLKRPSHLPQWLKRAVFHRDKGRCQRCFADLSGILTTNDDLRIDHMFPLAKGGSNDPTNFQLLCDNCNTSKGEDIVFDFQMIHTYW